MKIEWGIFNYDSDKTKAKRREKKLKKPKKKTEFSKLILIISWLSGSIVIAFACWLTYMMVIHEKHGDVQLIAIILTGGFAEISAGTAFYYWKAKNENMQKIGNNTGGQDHEEY